MMDLFIVFIAKYFIFIISLFVVGFMFLHHGHTKAFYKNTLIVFLSAVSAWVLAHILKDIIKHPRPDQVFSLIQDGTYSFPSGHTTFIATLGASLLNINKRVAYKILALAMLVGFARVLAGVHFWYDIIGGFVLGVAIAYLIGKAIKRFV